MHQRNIDMNVRASFIWTLWKLDLADRHDKVTRSVSFMDLAEAEREWVEMCARLYGPTI